MKSNDLTFSLVVSPTHLNSFGLLICTVTGDEIILPSGQNSVTPKVIYLRDFKVFIIN